MRKIGLMLVCMFALQPAVSSAQMKGYTSVFSPGHYMLHLKSAGGASVECYISIEKYNPCMSRKGWWGAGPYHDPFSVISAISLSVKRNKIEVPFSSYADLSNTEYAKLVNTPRGYSLRILGSDAAGAYRASIDFDGDRVTKRHVYGDAADGKPSETTKYGPYEPFR